MAYAQEHRPATTRRKLSRRNLLTLGALAVAAGFAPLPVLARTRRETEAAQGRREEPGSHGRRVNTVTHTRREDQGVRGRGTEMVPQARRGEAAPRGRTDTLAQKRRVEPAARNSRAGASSRGRRTESVAQARQEDISVRMRRNEPQLSSRRDDRPVYARSEDRPSYLYSAARPEKSLAIYNPNTGESLRTVYWFRGKYLSGAMRDIDYLLRDYRANEVKTIDPQLLDLLYSMSTLLETDDPFYVISGYRSPSTNAMLRLLNRAVAEHSMHIEGKAVDIRLPGHDVSHIRRAAVTLQAGGVGYYPYSNFVHVDTGPVRYW